MSNPRYIPRNFALHPRDFGHKPLIEWRREESWTLSERGRADTAQLQHGVAYGMLHLYMLKSRMTGLMSLADALEMHYARLQKMLTGNSVMQLEDLGRVRSLVGDSVDTWLLRGRHAALLKEGRDALRREAERESYAIRRTEAVLAARNAPPPIR